MKQNNANITSRYISFFKSLQIQKSIENIVIFLFLISINIFVIMFSNQISALDGDFDGYEWGAKLSGIAEALRQGELRLWNPNIWNGISGIHNFTDPFYPVSLLICKLFWNAEKGMLSFNAYAYFKLFHSIIATCGTYLLLKELKIKKIVCVFTILAGTPLIIGNTTYLQLCWIPVFAYLFLKACKKKDIINIFSISMGVIFGVFMLQELSQGAVLGVMVMGLFYLTVICIAATKKNGIKSIKKITLLFVIAGIIGAGLTAINLLPILEQQSDQLRIAREGFVSAAKGVSLENFYDHPVSMDKLRELLGAKSGDSWFGLITVIFCIMGLFAKKDYLEDRYGYIALLFGKVLYIFVLFASVSCYLPELFVRIPFVNMLRETYLYAGLLPLSTTLLVAYGVTALYSWVTNIESTTAFFYNSPLMCFVSIFVMLHYAIVNYSNRLIWILFSLVLGIALLVIFRSNLKVMHTILIFVGIINILHVHQYLNTYNRWTFGEAQNRYDEVMDGYKKLKDYMDSVDDGEQFYRVMSWGGDKGTISANSMVDVGGYYTMGYWEPIYRKTIDMHVQLDLVKRVTLDNVLFFIIAENESEEYMSWLSTVLLNDNFELAGTVDNIYPFYDAEEGQTLCVYKNKHYVGDAWFVYNYIKCSSEMPMEEQFAIINDASFSVTDSVLVESNDAVTESLISHVSLPDENWNIEIKNYTNNTIQLQCQTAQNGILVLAESDAKGWKAYVDGKKQEILTVNYGKRGLVIEQGEHTVDFIYSPDGYIIGKWITILTLCVCVMAYILLIIKQKRKSQTYEVK